MRGKQPDLSDRPKPPTAKLQKARHFPKIWGSSGEGVYKFYDKDSSIFGSC